MTVFNLSLADTLNIHEPRTSAYSPAPSSGPIIIFSDEVDGVASNFTLNRASSINPGDLLIVSMVTNYNTTVPATPTGWVLLGNTSLSFSYLTMVWYRIAGLSEPSNYTFTLPISQSALFTLDQYTNVDVNTAVKTYAGYGSSNALNSKITDTNYSDIINEIYITNQTVTVTYNSGTYTPIVDVSATTSGLNYRKIQNYNQLATFGSSTSDTILFSPTYSSNILINQYVVRPRRLIQNLIKVDDLLNLLDIVTYIKGLTKSPIILDFLTFTDSQSKSQKLNITHTHTLTITDIASCHFLPKQNLFQNLPFTDVVLITNRYSLTDTLVITDNPIAKTPTYFSFSDAIILTDIIKVPNTHLIDTLVITDGFISNQHPVVIVDTLTISHTGSYTKLNLSIIDTLTITDKVINKPYWLSIIDTLIIVDSQLPYKKSNIPLIDILTFNDVNSGYLVLKHNISLVDTVSFLEQFVRPKTFSLTDTLTLTDSVRNRYFIITDNLTLLDSLTNAHTYTFVDTLIINDTTSRLSKFSKPLVDNLQFNQSMQNTGLIHC